MKIGIRAKRPTIENFVIHVLSNYRYGSFVSNSITFSEQTFMLLCDTTKL